MSIRSTFRKAANSTTGRAIKGLAVGSAFFAAGIGLGIVAMPVSPLMGLVAAMAGTIAATGTFFDTAFNISYSRKLAREERKVQSVRPSMNTPK